MRTFASIFSISGTARRIALNLGVQIKNPLAMRLTQVAVRFVCTRAHVSHFSFLGNGWMDSAEICCGVISLFVRPFYINHGRVIHL